MRVVDECNRMTEDMVNVNSISKFIRLYVSREHWTP